MKILIWHKEKTLSSVGGPAGYLYNLNSYLKKNKITNIIFLDIYKENFFMKTLRKIKKSCIKKIRFFYSTEKRNILKLFENIERKDIFNKKHLNNCDIIHFHMSKELYKNFKNIENIKSIIVLTSHSPQLFFEEEFQANYEFFSQFSKEILDKYREYEYKAFERADYIIFPCEEAMEPYIKDGRMKSILKTKKIKYLLTGIESKKEIEDKDYFKNKLNIPQEAIVISYVGRHTEIKGYDILKQFGERILEKYANIYFVIAGKENENLRKLDNKRWIECGWTTEGAKIMKNSDLFILPNRETYFDLVFLEALSLNCNILCSNTGGNKYFKKYNSEGITYFDNENIDDMIKKFDYIYENLEKIKKNNINEKIYLKDFTVEKFGENYLKVMKEILQESQSERI